ncbi:NUDIX domain-containing protein [Candidatus Uhrbacteria bacterium]|nr:NUDIX domain-containing protein [Candidatus Uhrbacteria bacterium]
MKPRRINRLSSCCGRLFPKGQYPRICPKCSNPFYDNPIPVIVVLQPIISQNGRTGVILIERAIEPFIGGQALPGGFVEIENWRDAAVREMREECLDGINPTKLKPFAPYPYESTPDGRRILFFCLAPAMHEEALLPFTPNKEALDRRVIWSMEKSCFPIHTTAITAFFATLPA